jgi:hypothetical protein
MLVGKIGKAVSKSSNQAANRIVSCSRICVRTLVDMEVRDSRDVPMHEPTSLSITVTWYLHIEYDF